MIGQRLKLAEKDSIGIISDIHPMKYHNNWISDKLYHPVQTEIQVLYGQDVRFRACSIVLN